MMLPRKDLKTIESSIERRLAQTMAASRVRPSRDAEPLRKANIAETGLFVVRQSAVAGAESKVGDPSPSTRAAKSTRRPFDADRLVDERSGTGGGFPAGASQKQARQERLLGLMAALGPLLWYGHTALVWLKVV